MKIALTSDTHYGYFKKTKDLIEKMLVEMLAEKPDIILHAGDWGSTCTREVSSCMELFREYFSSPIVGVAGNHCYWSQNTSISLNKLIQVLEEKFDKYQVKELFIDEKNKVLIVAYSGWYSYDVPPSKDAWMMPNMKTRSVHKMMQEKSKTDLEKCLVRLNNPQYDGWTKIVVTHFNILPVCYHLQDDKISLEMSGDFDHFHLLKEAGMTHLCYGHTHMRDNSIVEDVKVFNAGADYNMPNFVTFTVGDNNDNT